MTVEKNIAVLVGSLRKKSFSRRVARALPELAPETLRLQIVEIGDLPHYNQDADEEGRPPAPWTTFRNAIRATDAVLFVTPEFNRSMPGALKNAIDVGSRPYAESVWRDKPAAVISQSPGAIGGFGAQHHLRQSLVGVAMAILPSPEVYLSQVGTLVADDGSITSEDTRKLLRTFLARFAMWIEATRG